MIAPLIASTFDEFVLSCDPKLVAQHPEYAGADPSAVMVARSRRLLQEQGVDTRRITTETSPAAIRGTLDSARPGDLVVLLADHDPARCVIDQWRTEY